VAYATWLAQVTGELWRLPTEAEWERAARGTDGRIYPWGNKWDLAGANTVEGKRGGTTPVGSYPSGASPSGALDMAGNVWEWTSSQYRPYPYNAGDGRERAESTGNRVPRGGAWDVIARFASTAFRTNNSGFVPELVRSNLGFRLARTGANL